MASISKERLFDSITAELDPIKQLILEQLPNPKGAKFSYDNSPNALGASDPFFSIEKPTEGNYNLDNLYDWYLTKNPEFKPVNTEGLNIKVPEFKFLIAVMAKDLLILHHTRQYPQKHKNNTNNSQKYKKDPDFEYKKKSIELFGKEETDNLKSMEVLALINKFINTYSYLEFLVILRHYLSLFSIGELYNQDTATICKKIKIIDRIMATPYIIYPTIVQISYVKVIYTMQAPVINFRLSNNRKNIHDCFDSPILELHHDLEFHGTMTHKWEQSKFASKPFVLTSDYPKINGIIQKLKPYISNTNEAIQANYNNQLLTFIIFYLTHEGFGNVMNLYDLYDSINSLTKPDSANNLLFLEDSNLKDAASYAYNQMTGNNLDYTLTEMKDNRVSFYTTSDITIYIINHILITFKSLWESLRAPLAGGSYNKKKYCKKLYKYKTKKQIKRKHKHTINR